MPKLSFQLVTPERTVLQEELDSLSCPTTLGQITILPGHIPLVANLRPGELIARRGDKEHYISVAGGFVEVHPVRSQTSNGVTEVVILADAAEHHYEIDEQKAKEAVAKAKKDLTQQKQSSEEYAKVAAALERNLSRLNIVRKHAHRRAPITGGGVFKE